MKLFTILALTLFATATAIEDFGGKDNNKQVETLNVNTTELVTTAFIHTAPF